MKYALMIGMLFVSVLYKAFVAMCLWNWFGSAAFGIPTVSFAHALGLVWLVQLFDPSVQAILQGHEQLVTTLLGHLVPEGAQEAFATALREHEEGLWRKALSLSIAQVAGHTTVLVLGFVVRVAALS